MQGEIYYLLIKIRRRAMVKKTAKEMLEIAIEMRKNHMHLIRIFV